MVVISILLDFANLTTTLYGMKTLGDSLRKTIAQRNLSNAMIGAVALNVVRSVLGVTQHISSVEEVSLVNEMGEYDGLSECQENQWGIDGYVRFSLLFLKTSDQNLKIEIFKQKNQILHEVNLALAKVGYKNSIEEIRMK